MNQKRTVFFDKNLDRQIRDFFLHNKYTDVAVLMDENTETHCYEKVAAALPAHLKIRIKSGEENKNINTCLYIWEALTNAGFDRKSLLVNLGGGVIGDMGGFCAATYKRGIEFINLPTTLLAQVDASIGGKLGIDFKGFKNHLGVFREPKQIFIYPDFLHTLNSRELKSGFAEVVKHSLIADSDTFEILSQKSVDDLVWEDIIPHSIHIKEKIVTADPREAGLRKILNFGHTIGHAIESYFLDIPQKRLLHGEAIAIGMICEAYLSHTKSTMSDTELNKIANYLADIYRPTGISSEDISKIIPLVMQDKKNEGGAIKASLLDGIGTCSYDINITGGEVKEALDFFNGFITAR